MAKSKVKRYALGDVVSSDDGAEEAANRSENAQSIMSEAKGDTMLKAMRDEAVKPKMVTKEELAKSGLSLRDYMNKQQGLTRRGGSSAPAAAPAKEAPYEKTPPDFSKIATPSVTKIEERKPASSGMSFKDKITKEAADAIKASGKKYPDMSVLQAPAKRAGMTAMSKKSSTFDDFGSGDGYKKGGMTRSSASKRADGIATKGHTKGKYL